MDATKAKVIICHQDNLETALVAGANAGVLRKNIFLLGDKPIGDIRPFTDLMNGRKAVPVELSAQEAKEKVAYLCFSSGTTGKSKGVMTT